jgi:hypothetical protein
MVNPTVPEDLEGLPEALEGLPEALEGLPEASRSAESLSDGLRVGGFRRVCVQQKIKAFVFNLLCRICNPARITLSIL